MIFIYTKTGQIFISYEYFTVSPYKKNVGLMGKDGEFYSVNKELIEFIGWL